jgi:hypothetical protein
MTMNTVNECSSSHNLTLGEQQGRQFYCDSPEVDIPYMGPFLLIIAQALWKYLWNDITEGNCLLYVRKLFSSGKFAMKCSAEKQPPEQNVWCRLDCRLTTSFPETWFWRREESASSVQMVSLGTAGNGMTAETRRLPCSWWSTWMSDKEPRFWWDPWCDCLGSTIWDG